MTSEWEDQAADFEAEMAANEEGSPEDFTADARAWLALSPDDRARAEGFTFWD